MPFDLESVGTAEWVGQRLDTGDGHTAVVVGVERAKLPFWHEEKDPEAYHTRAVQLNLSSGEIKYGCPEKGCFFNADTAMAVSRTHSNEVHPDTAPKRGKRTQDRRGQSIEPIADWTVVELLEYALNGERDRVARAALRAENQSLREEIQFLRNQLGRTRGRLDALDS